MKMKCPYCGFFMGCIECAGFMCEGCGSDLSSVAPKSDEPVVCQLNPWGYDPLDNDNDTEEMWDD